MTLTLARQRATFDPLRDKRYSETALGRSVVDWLAYLETAGKAPATLDQYERDVARGCLMFPHLGLDAWTDSELLHVARSFKPAERRTRMYAFSSLFRWAKVTRRITDNPVEYLPRMRRPKQKVVEVFNEAERQALMGLPLRDGALMRLLLEGGLRKGEARRLCYRDVLPEPMPGQLNVLGKGDKGRAVPLTKACAAAVAELAFMDGLEGRDHLWYGVVNAQAGMIRRRFFGLTGEERDVGATVFGRWWARCIEQAGVPYRNPHVTRHTFATRWLRNGGRLSTLCEVMGHESIQTTKDLYGHLDTRDVAFDLALIESEE